MPKLDSGTILAGTLLLSSRLRPRPPKQHVSTAIQSLLRIFEEDWRNRSFLFPVYVCTRARGTVFLPVEQ